MAIIGEHVKREILGQIERHLDTYMPSIARAYDRFDDGLPITFSVKLSANKRSEICVDVKTSIAFNVDRVKDDCEATVSEVQLSIPGMERGTANRGTLDNTAGGQPEPATAVA